MESAVEQKITALAYVVQLVPIGTNIGLVRLMWAMVNGSFLISRGAIHGALSASGFVRAEISHSWAALCNGAWEIDELLSLWQVYVTSQAGWCERRYAGYRVKSVDITAFWRPRLAGQVSKHYHVLAQKALPAIVFGVMIRAGEIQGKRVPLLQSLVRCVGDQSETAFRQTLLQAVVKGAHGDEISVFDAGFALTELQTNQVKRFVLRMAVNCTARRNEAPAYQGKGAHPRYGKRVRPLARQRLTKHIPASVADATGAFVFTTRTIHYASWFDLVTPDRMAALENPTVMIHVFTDALYQTPLVVATDLRLSAETCYLIYRDRWSVEHPPLAAKQMVGLHRHFVFAPHARFRLPELALFAGNILTQLAASLPPIPSGFWDRTPIATPGRLRRLLAQAVFPNLADFDSELRKKNSVSDHLPKGVDAHRRQKSAP